MTASAEIPSRNSPAGSFQRFVVPAFYASTAVLLGLLICRIGPGLASWAEAVFLLLATATILLALARVLPAQNVLWAAAMIAAISGVVEGISVKTGIPFGARLYTGDLGWELLGVLPWPVPLIWVAAILSSRGVARLILRPWRKMASYGFRVIGLTSLLTLVFDFNLEPFASTANAWWIWTAPGAIPVWYHDPWSNSLGWTATTLIILGFTTPWLINKSQARRAPPDYHPLVVWLALLLVPATGNAMQQLWLAAGFGLLAAAVVVGFASRGASW
jgi:uncharacterized membrane protein